jgi:excisionase family DNA binding protein
MAPVAHAGELWIDRETAARLFGVKARTIDRWIKDEQMPCRKVKGNKVEIPAIEVAAWVRARAQRMADEAAAARPADYDQARAEKLQVDTEIARLELAERQQALVRHDDADAAWEEAVERLRAACTVGLRPLIAAGLDRDMARRVTDVVFGAMERVGKQLAQEAA